jgi:hypothetical protein
MDGEIIMEEHFRPSDYRKQLELKEEVAQQKLSKIQYFGMKYFYDEFLNIKEVTMDSGLEDVYEALEKNRTKFISKCITHLVEDKQILELDDAVEFDAMYEIVSGWFDEYEKKYYEAPREEDYVVEEELIVSDEVKEEPPHQEEKPKGKKGKKKDDSEDKDNDGEMPEWLNEN